jgi:hypothetical protein
MTTIEAAFVDTNTFDPTAAGVLPADLKSTERPVISVVLETAATAPTTTAAAATGTYTMGVVSEPGVTHGITVTKGEGNPFYVDGQAKG